jgi:tetratricopeptide (TPR) repeat protein
MDSACDGVERQARVRDIGQVAAEDQPTLDRDGGRSHHRAAAHRQVAGMVHEQQPGVRARRHRLRQHRAGHVGVAPRRSQDGAAQVIGMTLQPLLLPSHRAPGRRRHAVGDEADRLAAGVSVDRGDCGTHRKRVVKACRRICALLFIMAAAVHPLLASDESARLRARAYEHLYNLDHAEATRDMEAAVRADPGDLASRRGLAVIAWLTTAFRRGTLTVDEYMGRMTRGTVAVGAPPADLAARFAEQIAAATTAAERAVAARPKDPNAHYELGAAVGLQASYTATIEGKLLRAFRVARHAYNAHERVLEMAPARHDAKLVVGTYRYVVATQSLPLRLFAYAAGFGGGKERGIRMVEEAAAHPSDAQTEAKVALVLLYNRESRWDDGLRVIRDLQRAYPRNRILWLEAGATTLRAGRPREADALLSEALTRLAADSRARMFGEEALLHLKRGMARRALGRAGDADQDLRRVLTLEARSWVHDAARAELSKSGR